MCVYVLFAVSKGKNMRCVLALTNPNSTLSGWVLILGVPGLSHYKEDMKLRPQVFAVHLSAVLSYWVIFYCLSWGHLFCYMRLEMLSYRVIFYCLFKGHLFCYMRLGKKDSHERNQDVKTVWQGFISKLSTTNFSF